MFDQDPRILAAVRKFDRFIDDPKAAADFLMLHRTADPDANAASGQHAHTDGDVATALTGRAIADIISPGIDSQW